MSLFLERRTIRKFKTDVKISHSELEEMLTIAYRAPSSMNMQPTRLVIVESKEARKKLETVFIENKLQLETASQLIVIFSDLNKFEMAPKIFNTAYELGIMPKEVRDFQLNRMENLKTTIDPNKVIRDGLVDGGLFAMQLMLVAKSYGYDTCPIGGFNKLGINDALGIDKSLLPVLIIAIGKRDEEGYQSYRLPLSDTIEYL
ncbi:MAG: nitroreductase family protein [Acholeplasma sp.]|nr:nitroreductase family protein [Acholeplasma sp.]